MTPEQAFGNVVRKYRKKSALSQEELAFKCGLDRTFVGMVERGERSPSLNSIMTLAKNLDLRVSAIFEEVELMLNINEQGY